MRLAVIGDSMFTSMFAMLGAEAHPVAQAKEMDRVISKLTAMKSEVGGILIQPEYYDAEALWLASLEKSAIPFLVLPALGANAGKDSDSLAKLMESAVGMKLDATNLS